MLVLQKGLILPVPMYGGSYFFIQPVTEKLKMQDQMEWVRKMNNIRSRAVEIIDVELICV